MHAILSCRIILHVRKAAQKDYLNVEISDLQLGSDESSAQPGLSAAGTATSNSGVEPSARAFGSGGATQERHAPADGSSTLGNVPRNEP